MGTDDARDQRDERRERALRHALLAWGSDELRDLPWRQTREPWRILVAEIMLQQTQVSRVAPLWTAFIERWPTPADCAAAPRSEILRAWKGLGYNRRAVALHEAATRIADEHDGVVPSGLDALLALPGVGPYTARAVRVFAYELDDAVVDVNAARVLARAVAGRSLTGREVQRLADEQLPSGDAWLWNQSVLELGATLCRKRVAQCAVCPVAPHCAWHGEGPDPAAGSAGTGGRQSRFEGSDRQGRGRLLDALRVDDLPAVDADAVTGWADHDRTARIVDGLVADGLVVRDGSQLTLPA